MAWAVEPAPQALYEKLSAFELATGDVFQVSNFVLKRDRVEITLSGHF